MSHSLVPQMVRAFVRYKIPTQRHNSLHAGPSEGSKKHGELGGDPRRERERERESTQNTVSKAQPNQLHASSHRFEVFSFANTQKQVIQKRRTRETRLKER